MLRRYAAACKVSQDFTLLNLSPGSACQVSSQTKYGDQYNFYCT